ncbi:MAG: hypothetical protein ACPGXK_16145 [Phycisphaerae bacterium]
MAIPTFNLEEGIITCFLRTRDALRILVSISAMGSDHMDYNLPRNMPANTGYQYLRNKSA